MSTAPTTAPATGTGGTNRDSLTNLGNRISTIVRDSVKDAKLSDLIPVTSVLMSLSINSLLDAAYSGDSSNNSCGGYAEFIIRSVVFALLVCHILMYSGWYKWKSRYSLERDIENMDGFQNRVNSTDGADLMQIKKVFDHLLCKNRRKEWSRIVMVCMFNLFAACVWLFSTTNIYLICFISGGKSISAENLKVVQIISGVMILFLSGVLTTFKDVINEIAKYKLSDYLTTMARDDPDETRFTELLTYQNRLHAGGPLINQKIMLIEGTTKATWWSTWCSCCCGPQEATPASTPGTPGTPASTTVPATSAPPTAPAPTATQPAPAPASAPTISATQGSPNSATHGAATSDLIVVVNPGSPVPGADPIVVVNPGSPAPGTGPIVVVNSGNAD